MRIAMVVGLAGVIVATSAAAQDVTWDYAKGTDFTRLKTYAWTAGHPLTDPMNHQRIVSAVEAQLTAKGFSKVDLIRVATVTVTSLGVLLGANAAQLRELTTPALARHVRMIPDLMLRDVAVAVYDSVSSVVYYNPRFMRQFSPDLQAFFLAHEYAHIELKHTRSSALRADMATHARLLQDKELAADCLAVTRLGASGRRVSMAAMRFFARLGATRFDDEHPTGTARARNILECIQE
jgi:hypothetical protein